MENRQSMYLERWFWPIVDFWFAQNTDVAILEKLCLIIQFLQDFSSTPNAIKLLATGFAHLKKLFLLIDAQKPAAK